MSSIFKNVPAQYVHPCWEDAQACLAEQTVRTILLFGPPGTGKTMGALNALRDTCTDLSNVTMDMDTSVQEYRGIPLMHAGKLTWRYGSVSGSAMAESHGLVLNEINQAAGAVLSFLYGVLDDPRFAEIRLDNETRISVGEGFRHVATTNAEVNDIPEALADRYQAKIRIVAPHPEGIMSLPEDLRDAAFNAGCEESPSKRISLRPFVNFAQLRETIGAEIAARVCFGEKATEILHALAIAAA